MLSHGIAAADSSADLRREAAATPVTTWPQRERRGGAGGAAEKRGAEAGSGLTTWWMNRAASNCLPSATAMTREGTSPQRTSKSTHCDPTKELRYVLR